MHDGVKTTKSHERKAKGSVTSHDVARVTGVSQATVSRILSNSPKHRFTEETRRRVWEEAERLGYRPNAVGRSLRERRTRVIGFYTWYGNLDARNPFLAEIIGGLQRGACNVGYSILLKNFPEGTPVNDIFGELTSGQVDGLVVHTRVDDPLVDKLAESSLPVVAVTDRVVNLPSVVVDDQSGIQQAINHLVEHGHQRIAFLYPTMYLASAQARRDAYEEEMMRRGWEVQSFAIQYEQVDPVVEAWQQMADPPTAICCWNDLVALNLLHTCQRRGIRVPEELAIVGFDGLLDIRLLERPITTIEAHWPDVAQRALQLVLERGNEVEIPPVSVFPVSLRIGETT